MVECDCEKGLSEGTRDVGGRRASECRLPRRPPATSILPPVFAMNSLPVALLVVFLLVSSSSAAPRSFSTEELSALMKELDSSRLLKRSHNIEARALNNFKNCYFSPIQCVLMERR